MDDCEMSHNIYSPTGSGILLDIASELNIRVDPVKLSIAENDRLKQLTLSLYDKFEPTKCQTFAEKNSSSSLTLQCHFYQSILEDSGQRKMNLLLPASCSQFNSQSRSFNKEKSPKQERLPLRQTEISSKPDDFVSRHGGLAISKAIIPQEEIPSIARERPGISRSNVGAAYKQDDAVSISSQTSGSLNMSEPHSCSSLAFNVFDSNTNEVEENEEGNGHYEDISDILDDYAAEKKKIEESMKQKSSSSTSKGFANIFKTVKEKKKKLKKKEIIDSTSSSESLKAPKNSLPDNTNATTAYSEEKFPNSSTTCSSHVTTAHARSSSESYDELNPDAVAYLSDNYEAVSFTDVDTTTIDTPPPSSQHPPCAITPDATSTSYSTAPPPLNSLPAPLTNFDKLKSKIKLRPHPSMDKMAAFEAKSASPYVSDSDGGYVDADIVVLPEHVMKKKKKEKKEKMKAKMGSATIRMTPPMFSPPSVMTDATIQETSGEANATKQVPPFQDNRPVDTTVSALRGEITRLHTELDSLRADFKKMSITVEKLAALNKDSFSESEVGEAGREESVEENLRVLERMTTNEVTNRSMSHSAWCGLPVSSLCMLLYHAFT